MARHGINRTLLRWLEQDPIGQALVAEFDSNFLALAKKFFNATSDAERLVAAELLAKIILIRNDMQDMAILRREVRTLELMRAISYPRQTDHSAHTVYVFFLGIWLYANCPSIASAFGERYLWYGNPLIDFVFPWEFAGLLHDIGYIFSEPANVTPSSRRLAERFFQTASLTAQLQPRNPDCATDFLEFMVFIRKLTRDVPWEWPFYCSGDCSDQLNSLRRLPWLSHFNEDVDAFGLFHRHKPASTIGADGLEVYAYSVAESGYDGHSVGQVDHAIASALFLLQWSTYWYWLADRTKGVNQDWYELYFCKSEETGQQRYNYDFTNVTKLMVPTLYSVACHNIQTSRPEGRRLLPIRLHDDPLAYLSILCDELQKWDRFPAGNSHIHNLEDFAESSLVSEDIQLSLKDSPRFHVRCRNSIRKRIVNALDDRLLNWSTIVRVT